MFATLCRPVKTIDDDRFVDEYFRTVRSDFFLDALFGSLRLHQVLGDLMQSLLTHFPSGLAGRVEGTSHRKVAEHLRTLVNRI